MKTNIEKRQKTKIRKIKSNNKTYETVLSLFS